MEEAILRELIHAGAVHAASARGVPGGFVLVVSLAEGEERVLQLQRGKIRIFSRLDTVASRLRDMGLTRFSVETDVWSPAGLL